MLKSIAETRLIAIYLIRQKKMGICGAMIVFCKKKFTA